MERELEDLEVNRDRVFTAASVLLGIISACLVAEIVLRRRFWLDRRAGRQVARDVAAFLPYSGGIDDRVDCEMGLPPLEPRSRVICRADGNRNQQNAMDRGLQRLAPS